MKTLDELRREIDAADRDLIEAFGRRLNTAKSIGQLKKEQGRPVFDPEREKAKIAHLEKLASPEARPYIEELYTAIMGMAKDLESRPLYGVLGRSIPHTYSPEIHSLITSDYAYTVIEKEEEELASLWEQGRAGVYGGFNVTIPYKRNAFAMCDELAPSASSVGAVNTVVFRDGRSFGANTDVYGFKYMMKSSGIDVNGKPVIILGTGGASAAVFAALKDLQASDIRFVSRSGDINYENVYDVCADAKVIVNCTPVGMYPDIEVSPVDLKKFKNLEAVADIIYNPSRTKLLYEAEKLGLKTAGGLKMLVAQAFKASAFFLGTADDSEAESRFGEEDIERVTGILQRRMKNITVIGMPGSGKTRFAQELGIHLGRKVIDLDDAYTEVFGETPAQTISSKGEDEFRRNETKVAGKYLSQSGLIISCGGGIVVKEENHFLLKCNSEVVYNKRPLDVLCMSGRPLSAKQGVEKLYEQRKDSYESLADMVIDVGAKESSREYIDEAVRLYDENTCT